MAKVGVGYCVHSSETSFSNNQITSFPTLMQTCWKEDLKKKGMAQNLSFVYVAVRLHCEPLAYCLPCKVMIIIRVFPQVHLCKGSYTVIISIFMEKCLVRCLTRPLDMESVFDFQIHETWGMRHVSPRNRSACFLQSQGNLSSCPKRITKVKKITTIHLLKPWMFLQTFMAMDSC